jgi:hypothetical protein
MLDTFMRLIQLNFDIHFFDIFFLLLELLLFKPLDRQIPFLPLIGKQQLLLKFFPQGQNYFVFKFVSFDLPVDLLEKLVHFGKFIGAFDFDV